MAFANPNITAFAVEATEFPDLARRYRVNGVPKTVVNDEVEILGGLPQDAFVLQALAGSPRRLIGLRDFLSRGPRSQKSSPKADHAANAIHSARVKLPGTDGTTFIRTIATLTRRRATPSPPIRPM